jgi:translation initiation factor eIF-2B subunit epsilon
VFLYLDVARQGRVHWTEPFLQHLSHDVKLVGSTISCEGTPLEGMVKEKWRHNPHVQSYAVATDKVRVKLAFKMFC